MRKKINTDSFDFHLSLSLKQEIEQKLRCGKLIDQLKEDLYCSPRYRNFFDSYDEETIHSFVEAYANKKAFYIIHGKELLQKEEVRQLYFHNLAENLIWEIQQKKLFDLQCLWRAEKVILKDVKVTKDFFSLEASIKSCPHIEPVTRDELQLYIDYLFSDDYSDKDYYMQWQDYDFIKNQSLMFCNSGIPAWFRFFDKQVHGKNMHDLADIRGEKEFFYLDLLNKKNSSVKKLHEDVQNENNAKPSLHFNFKTLEFFINTFEDKSIVNYFYAAEKISPELSKNAELDESLQLLTGSDENIPIHANNDWKDAILEAAKILKTKKIAEALWIVYDQYMIRIQTKLPFYNEDENIRQQLILRNIENYKSQILKARVLNGEPEDFNF